MLKPTNSVLRKNNLITESFQDINCKNQKLNLMEHRDSSSNLKNWASLLLIK